MRLGIGHPGDKSLVHHHVLSDFKPDERLWVNRLCDAIVAQVPLLVKGEDMTFASKVALEMSKP